MTQTQQYVKGRLGVSGVQTSYNGIMCLDNTSSCSLPHCVSATISTLEGGIQMQCTQTSQVALCV